MLRLAAALALLVAAPALAQTNAGTQARGAPRTEIRFDEVERVEGELASPDVTLVDPPSRPRFGGLIKVRQNFADKLMGSVSELR
jgi:hypothetical protein